MPEEPKKSAKDTAQQMGARILDGGDYIPKSNTREWALYHYQTHPLVHAVVNWMWDHPEEAKALRKRSNV